MPGIYALNEINELRWAWAPAFAGVAIKFAGVATKSELPKGELEGFHRIAPRKVALIG